MKSLRWWLALVVLMVSCAAHSQQPIRINIGFVAGSAPDILARLISERMRDSLGRVVLVDCLRFGNLVFVAGLTSRGDDGRTIEGSGEYEQARIIFRKIRSLVEAAGGTMDNVAKLTIFVTDISKNVEVWRARKEFFSGDFPAASLVEVSALATPEILVEIEAVAVIDQ